MIEWAFTLMYKGMAETAESRLPSIRDSLFLSVLLNVDRDKDSIQVDALAGQAVHTVVTLNLYVSLPSYNI